MPPKDRRRRARPKWPASRLGTRLLLLTTFFVVAHFTICQRIDGQFFTPGLLIINSPAPHAKREAGKRIVISLEICGDGILPPSNTDAGSNLATAILSVDIFLVNRALNLTVKQGPQMIQAQRGHCVKQSKFLIPRCTPPGDYQMTFHEHDRINGEEYYAIYSLPFHVQENLQDPANEEEFNDLNILDSECAANPAPEAQLSDFRSSVQPFARKGVTGFNLRKDKMPLPTDQDVFVPPVEVTTFIVEDKTPPPLIRATEQESNRSQPVPATALSLDVTQPAPNVTLNTSNKTSATSPKPSPSGDDRNEQKVPPPAPTRKEETSPKISKPQSPSLPPARSNHGEPISVVGLKSQFHNNPQISANRSTTELPEEDSDDGLVTQPTAKFDIITSPSDSPDTKPNSQDLFTLQSEPKNQSSAEDSREETGGKPKEQLVFSVPLIASSGAGLNFAGSLQLIGSTYVLWALIFLKTC